MDRFKSLRRVQVPSQETLDDHSLDNNGDDVPRTLDKGGEQEDHGGGDEGREASGDPHPFIGMKVSRRASIYRECTDGDYIGVESDPYLKKILSKQGDTTVLFADKVLKFTGSGKMKRRILLITDFAIYLVDPEADSLKRRIALAAVDRLCLSQLSDNFFAIIIPTEYDLLMASIRRKEIISVLVEATKSTSEEIEVVYSNRFEYHAAADMVKEVEFEEVDGGIKTRFRKKEGEAE
ncbi:uncharacterized protein A4U43_C05F27210 [Asparagus officinalis]|uniref:TH1 domain-containing protein n=1 Tax=Asparagus officinalis TaxID=4686 RepID=A0A5P1EWF7_ASPOF|nr:myosin ID heavy chain [Asparagus officinalis]ONK69833.1 uncharacterized protein A4U43_C05F27210 [Asparagus officinalis]